MLNTELLSFMAPLGAVAGMAVLAARKDGCSCLSLRRKGILANRQIKQLLVDLQQHRGMANAYLNGDSSFWSSMEKKQAAISQDIAMLDDSCGRELMTPRRWDGIKNNWQILCEETRGLTQEESFHRHSMLIRAVLYSLGDVAERSQIVGIGAADPALVNALWSDLPAVAEGLGQARGLGSGVAAKGDCSSVARIKLRFLEGRIGETMKWVSRDLTEIGIARTMDTSISRSWEETSQAVSEFLALLEGKIINVARPAIDAEHYFGAATKSLDKVFHVYDVACDTLDGALGGALPSPA
ncbi:MAG: hypothetical protein WC073_09225 [Sterolibacterium sp.]